MNRLGHCSLDVTLAYLRGREAEGEQEQNFANQSRWRGMPRDVCILGHNNRIASCLPKITGPNLFEPHFSVSALIIKQFGRLFSA